MTAFAHPGLLNQALTNEVKNGLRLAGFNLKDITPDRPLPPDGLKLMAELWRNGATVELIMEELNLSEARASADLLFLELKGEISGFIDCLFGRDGDGKNPKR